MTIRRVTCLAGFLAAITVAIAASSAPLTAPEPTLRLPKSIRSLPTPYYSLYTDLPPEAAQEAGLRMTRMAEEYHERTRGFSGSVTQRLPFYLFTDNQDYVASGGPRGSAGVYIR